MANGWRPRPRRDRYGHLSDSEQIGQLWDELDDLDSKGTEAARGYINELEQHKAAYRADELRRAAENNRTLVMVVVALIGVLASIIVPLLTR